MTTPDAAPTTSQPAVPTELVTLSGIRKQYQSGTLALDDVTLTIRQPEFVSLVGPSGCGKSTILRLIAGLGTASAGTLAWRPGLARGDIGFVFQEPTLMPWATIAENVALALELAGQSGGRHADAVIQAIDRVGLSEFSDAYPRALSGGMRMRVSLARALVSRPSILLMDEPFAALDEITRFTLIEDLLAWWHGQPWTVVFVTHSVFESVYMSERILVMSPRPGRIVEEIIIDEPWPRSPDFRGSARYAAHCQRVSTALRHAHGGTAP